jgi:DNA-binding NarL/FixJ family response regulator
MERRDTDGGRPGRKRPRVVIADNHDPARAVVRLALEQNGFVVCREEATAPDVVAAALADPPDLCLLDIDIPGGAIPAAQEIRSRLPETQVVMLSEARNEDDLFAALEAGASGYLLKEINPARLAPALREVVNGGAALSRAMTAALIAEFRARASYGQGGLVRRSKKDLTSREWEVLDCLVEGLSTRRIAKRLFITETTVRRHVGAIVKKLGVASREAAVEFVARRSRKMNAE